MFTNLSDVTSYCSYTTPCGVVGLRCARPGPFHTKTVAFVAYLVVGRFTPEEWNFHATGEREIVLKKY